MPLQLLRPHQVGLFGRARPPGGPSPNGFRKNIPETVLAPGPPGGRPLPVICVFPVLALKRGCKQLWCAPFSADRKKGLERRGAKG